MRYSIAFAAVASVLPTALAAGACPPLELIYARATTEPVGLGAAGGLLQTDLKKNFPEAAVYAVKYPASMGSLNTCEGPKDLIARIKERVDSCPGIKIALGGHSQGGAVVTATIEKIPKKYLSSIVAVTLFGSPPCSDLTQKGTDLDVAALFPKCRSFCNLKDTICDGPPPMGGGGPRAKCSLPKGTRRDIMVKDFMMGYPSYVDPLKLTEGVASEFRLNDRLEEEGTCGDGPKGERGHQAKVAGRGVTDMAAHMAYNKDGWYVAQAACFIKKQFQAAGGATAAGTAE